MNEVKGGGSRTGPVAVNRDSKEEHMRIYHYVGSFLLGAALIAPAGMLAGTNFQDDHHQDDKHRDRDDKNQRRCYDRNHKDYHKLG
jgi:hypothetical protein